jgi:hypothetical protein
MGARAKGFFMVLTIICCLQAASRQPAADNNEQPVELTDQSQLFLDDFLIERMEGLTRVLNHPEKLTNDPKLNLGKWLFAPGITPGEHLQFGPVVKADRPWEDGQVVLQPGAVLCD